MCSEQRCDSRKMRKHNEGKQGRRNRRKTSHHQKPSSLFVFSSKQGETTPKGKHCLQLPERLLIHEEQYQSLT